MRSHRSTIDQVSGSGPVWDICISGQHITHTRAVTDGCWTYVSTHRSLALQWHVQQQNRCHTG